MSEFGDLASIYRHLEDNAGAYHFAHDISELFSKIAMARQSTRCDADAMKAQWEAEFFYVLFDAGDIKYANLNNWPQEQVDYLLARSDLTSNPVLKARYSHLLWCSPDRKHSKYGRQAVDSYLEVVATYERLQIEDPTACHGHNLLNALINAHSLAYQTKWRTDDVKAEIRRIVLYFPYDNTASIYVHSRLIEYMLKEKRKFSDQDFELMDEVCWAMAEILIDKRNEEVAKDFLDLGERIDSKTEGRRVRWVRRKAECNEILLERRKHTPNAIDYLQGAIRERKRVGDLEKVKELESKYPDVVAGTPVAKITVEHDLSTYIEQCESRASGIAQRGPDEIVRFLAADAHLLPRYEILDELVNAQNSESPFLSRINVGIVDEWGHQVQTFTTDEGKKYANILRFYKVQLESLTIEYVTRVFAAAIKQKKLSTEIILEFLRSYTWIGKTLHRPLPGQRVRAYRWLDLVAPAVEQCITHIVAHISDSSNPQPCVLAVDSLTLKLEGLVRDLCRSHGITTWEMRDRNDETVDLEKDLGKLLRDAATEKLFKKDDHLFLKFLLIEQGGYNLRNRVAHALFMGPEDYTVDYCVWGLLALLRLSKYSLGDYVGLAPKTEESEL